MSEHRGGYQAIAASYFQSWGGGILGQVHLGSAVRSADQ